MIAGSLDRPPDVPLDLSMVYSVEHWVVVAFVSMLTFIIVGVIIEKVLVRGIEEPENE